MPSFAMPLLRAGLRPSSMALLASQQQPATRFFSSVTPILRTSSTPPTSAPSSNDNKQEGDSTSALDYKLQHKLRKLPPLPSLEPPEMEASEAVSNILYNTPAPSKQPFKRHILNTLVQNEPGVLSRVAGTLAARGFNIDSLVVCATEIRDLSRMCIVLRGQDGVVEQARRQLEDLVPVWAVLDYTQTKVIERELMLVKVSILGPEYFEESQYGYNGSPLSSGMTTSSGLQVPPELLAERESHRGGNAHERAPTGTASDHVGAVSEARAGGPKPLTPTEALRVKSDNMRSVIALAEQFRGRVVDVSTNSVIVEVSGKSSRCDAFLKLVRPFGVLECARSGTMVLPRSPITSSWSGQDEQLSEEDLAEIDASLLPPG